MITLQADFNHLDAAGRLRLGDLRMHQQTPFVEIAAKHETIIFIDGDDMEADHYWRWPLTFRAGVREKVVAVARQIGAGIVALPKKLWRGLVGLFTGQRPAPPPRPVDAPRQFPCGCNGSPLHIVNVTINETKG